MRDALADTAGPSRQAIHPPMAPVRPSRTEVHGVELVDPYAWLRDPNYPEVTDPEVLDHLRAENTYTDTVLEPRQGLKATLFAELRGRIKEDDATVPYRDGGFAYYSRYRKGAQYPVLCRTAVAPGDPLPQPDNPAEEVILDVEARAEGLAYFGMGDTALSPDHGRLAFSQDTAGDERYTIFIRDLGSGAITETGITGCSGGIVWAEDPEWLFYIRLDSQHRPNKVFRHRIGSDPSDDVLVFEEHDPGFFVGVDDTLSRRFITISTQDKITSEIHLIDSARPTEPPRVVAPRQTGHEYDVDHHGPARVEDATAETDWLFILTNDTGRNFRLARAPVATPEPEHWVEEIAHNDAVYLTDLMVLRDHLVLESREAGLPHVEVIALSGPGASLGRRHRIAMPDPAYSLSLGAHAEFVADRVRLGYSSLVRPPSSFDYIIAEDRLELLKEREIPSGYDRTRYVSERLMVPAPDGVRVPVSIVYAKDTPLDGSAPCYLYAYGSYGHGIDPYFSTNRLSLLDRGFVFALAHIRGGDDMGYAWYEDGKLLKKRNTFTDFIAAGESLVEHGYTARGKIACVGGSAGGMLVGAVLNMAPDLFGAAVADVPFVDVLNTMLDETLPLTPPEFTEWGNPKDPEYFAYIKSYSPYDNVTAKAYPALYVTAGISDPRVTYWEPAKWVAKLRATKTDENLLLLRTNMDAGHGGASGRWEALRELAEQYVFVLDVLAPDAGDQA